MNRIDGWCGVLVLGLGLILAGVPGERAAAQIPPGPPVGRVLEVPPPAPAGRVLDERGEPVAGATVRLYRRDGRYTKRDPQVEEARTGPDGGYRLATRPPVAAPGADRWSASHLVLVADHPDHAVGWATVPDEGPFAGEIRLAARGAERTVAVTDVAGRPLAGATVAVTGLSDSSSAQAPVRAWLELDPVDGPLAATTDAAGRATFRNLPATDASFAAFRPGFARTLRFRGDDPIRLTPAATLAGTLAGPDGQPLAGVTVVANAGSMWDFQLARTDDRGHYRIADLPARGWDMSPWRAGMTGDGSYRVWIEGDRHAVPTQKIVLEPGERRTLDLRAQPAGIVRATVVEDGTGRRVPGVRVWGFDRETGASSRFDARTDAQGVATFASTPAEISLSIASPPKGTFLLESVGGFDEAHTKFDFAGGEAATTLVLPIVGGRLVTIAGKCVGPDRAPLPAVTVHAASEVPVGSISPRHLDAAGGFTLDGIPAGRNLGLHALSDDGRLGGWLAARIPKLGAVEPPLAVPLRPTVAVDLTLTDEAGALLKAQDVALTPKVGPEFRRLQRYVRTDGQGRVFVGRIIPGLTYSVARIAQGLAYEVEPPPTAGTGAAAVRAALGSDVILAPAAER